MTKTCNNCFYFHHDDYDCRGEDNVCYEFIWKTKQMEREYINSIVPVSISIVPNKETALELLVDAGIFNSDGAMNDRYK
jgi:hypothetical protein